MGRTLELKLPPLALVLIIAALMGLVARTERAGWMALPGQRAVAIGIILGGAAIVALDIAKFRRAGTTVNPLKPGTATTLVVTGIHRLTRNPMYLGLLLALLGWALFLSNALALAGVPAYVLYMNRFQIEPEERALAATFGPAYTAYKSRVRRWL